MSPRAVVMSRSAADPLVCNLHLALAISSFLSRVDFQSTAVGLGKLVSRLCAFFHAQLLSVDGLHIIAQLDRCSTVVLQTGFLSHKSIFLQCQPCQARYSASSL